MITTPIEMKMEAASNHIDTELLSMLEDLEDEYRESEFAGYAEVMKVKSDKFKHRED